MRPNRIRTTCQRCGVDFLTWPSAIRRGQGKFCGFACRRKPEQFVCPTCGGYKGRYSARCMDCQRQANNDVDARFDTKVNRNGPVPSHRPELGPCEVWTGGTARYGYGVFAIREFDLIPAHRYAWQRVYGPIPKGMWVLHKCDNPPCVRVDHLFLGTALDNTSDMWAKGRGSCQGGPSGEAAGMARLTEANVREIRRRKAAGETGPMIAADYGVTPGTVYHVVSRHTWKHVE